MSDGPEKPDPPMIDVTPDATTAAPPPPRRWRFSLHDARWVVLGVAVVLLAGAAIWWLVPASPPAPATNSVAYALQHMDDRLAALAQRQTALDQTLARLEQQLPRGEPAAHQEEIAVLRQLAQRIDLLEQHAGAPPADAAEFAQLKDELQRISERLDKIEAAPAPPAPPAAEGRPQQDLLLALAPLESALRGTQPFSAELAPIETAAQDRPEVKAALAPLEALAPQGLPSLATLARRFEQDVAPAVMRSARTRSNADWSDRVLDELRGLVVVRRTGDVGAQSKDPVEAALARAEQALAANDLAGAVAALEGLPRRAAAPAKDWLAAAKGRLAAETAMATLERLVTAPPETQEH